MKYCIKNKQHVVKLRRKDVAEMAWECLGNVLKMSLRCPGKLVNWRHMTQNCPDFTTFVLIKLGLQNRDDLKTNLKTNFGT